MKTFQFYSLSRYASLYFCCCIQLTDNELLTLEVIHRYVELLDKYFGNVSDCGLHMCYALKALASASLTYFRYFGDGVLFVSEVFSTLHDDTCFSLLGLFTTAQR